MNTKTIIYDDNCPLCAAYTSAFVKSGLLTSEGRKNFSNISPELLTQIDLKKSMDEIPLVDTATGKVWYGIDALLEILQQKFPLVKTIGNVAFIKWLLRKFYKLISYNRRIIVASNPKKEGINCTPSYNVPYRLLFMIIFLLFNTVMLFPLQHYVLSKTFLRITDIFSFQAAHFLLVGLNVFIAAILSRKSGIEYLGQVNMLALSVILLLIPLLFLNQHSSINLISFNNFYLGGLTIFIMQEYIRRMRFINFFATYPLVVCINTISVSGFIAYFILQRLS